MNDPTINNLDVLTRTAQIIKGALVMGCVMFLGICLIQVLPRAAANVENIVVYVLGGTSLVIATVAFIVPASVVNKNRTGIAAAGLGEEAAIDKLAALYQTQMIVRAALFEGGTFMNLMGFMITGSYINLALAVMLIASQFIDFPTRDRITSFVREQLSLLELERPAGSP